MPFIRKAAGRTLWTSGAGQTQKTFSENTFENCLNGIVIDLDPAFAANAVAVDACTFRNNVGAGVYVSGQGNPSVQNCVFELPTAPNQSFANLGDYPPNRSVGVRSHTGIDVLHSTFSYSSRLPSSFKPSTAILAEVEEGNVVEIEIKGNTFREMTTSIELTRIGETENAVVDLEMRCNTFEQTTPIPAGQTHTGLWVGNGVVLNGPIGNSGLNGPPLLPDPSGNVWPIDPASLAANPVTGGPGVINNWLSPANWTSLRNDNPSFNLEYWAYNNEFVGSVPLVNVDVLTRPNFGEQIMMYRTGIPNPPVDDPGNVVFREQCSTDLPDVFPLRTAVDSTGNTVTSSLDSDLGQGLNALLGDAVPNPASTQVRIPVFIPESSGFEYQLSVFDLSGKKALIQLPVKQRGKVMVEIALSDLPAGVYGYSLTESGKTLGTRKLVIVK